MDLNAIVAQAIEEGIAKQKDELIHQTLEEERTHIMDNLKKQFGGVYAHLENVCEKYNVDEQTTNKILNIVNDFMNFVEETVTDKKIECISGNNGYEPERNRVVEVIADREGRITIPADALEEAGLVGVVQILKERDEDNNTIYIVGDQFLDYDREIYELIAERGFDNSLRISVAKLCGAKAGDVIGIDVYDNQLIVYNTDNNVNDEPPVQENTKKDMTVEEVLKKLTDTFKTARTEADLEKLNELFPFLKIYRITI